MGRGPTDEGRGGRDRARKAVPVDGEPEASDEVAVGATLQDRAVEGAQGAEQRELRGAAVALRVADPEVAPAHVHDLGANPAVALPVHWWGFVGGVRALTTAGTGTGT